MEKNQSKMRQTNIQNLKELNEDKKLEFQKVFEKELETRDETIQYEIVDKRINIINKTQ